MRCLTIRPCLCAGDIRDDFFAIRFAFLEIGDDASTTEHNNTIGKIKDLLVKRAI